MSPETAMRLSAYWACVRLYGQTMGSLPLDLYRLAPDGSRTLASDDPLYDLLRHQPCADHDAVEFWEGIGACLATWGNAYALRQTLGGRLVALEPLRPFWMQVYRSEDGAPVYRYSDPRTTQIDYGPNDIFHVRGFGFADLMGLSPLAFHAEFLGASMAADEVSGSLFRNGMRLTGWFRYKGGNGVLTKQQQEDTKAALVDRYRGSANAGKAGLLPGDFDWIATNMNPNDAELLGNRRFNIEEIARAFGVPPILIGHIAEGATMWGSGVEHIVLAWMTTGFRPYLRRVEAAIARQLIGRAGRQTMAAAFDVEQLLRGDNKGMADTYSQLVNNGLKTRNEVRRTIYNDPPVEGGDKLTVQSALIPIDKLGEIAKLPSEKPVGPGADVAQSGGGQKRRLPFFEGGHVKAFDPSRHPHGARGRFVEPDEIVDLVHKAIGTGQHEEAVHFDHADGARFSEPAGRDVHGWAIGIDAQFARHAHNQYGPGSGDRIPIAPADFRHLPEIARHGRVTSGGKTKSQGMKVVIVRHTINETRYHAAFTVRQRGKRLLLQTFKKLSV